MMRVGWMVVAVGLGLLAGCSSAQPKPTASDMEQTELREVNDMLHAAAGRGGRAPTQIGDLARYHNLYPGGYEAIKSGNIVVAWGTPPLDEGELGKNEKVLAYGKDVPANGGYVLLSAGTIKKMSASEFSAVAPKAAK